MKLVSVLFALALAAGGVAVAKDGPPSPPLATASSAVRADVSEVFRLEANGGDRHCTVAKADAVAGGRSVLRLASGCAALYPALVRVAYWRDDAGGTVTFTTDAGDPVVSFAVSDGLDYESFEPRNPLLALVSRAD